MPVLLTALQLLDQYRAVCELHRYLLVTHALAIISLFTSLGDKNGKCFLLTSIVNRPCWTAVNKRGSMVSRPGNPGGGFSESFSSNVCGATEQQNDNLNSHNDFTWGPVLWRLTCFLFSSQNRYPKAPTTREELKSFYKELSSQLLMMSRRIVWR